MSAAEALYWEVKDDLEAVAEPLFLAAWEQVELLGSCMPAAAKLTADGEVELVDPDPDAVIKISTLERPLLVEALQRVAVGAEAVALCEWVRVLDDGEPYLAVKVHVHHQRGLSAAYFMPAVKSSEGWEHEEIHVRAAPALVAAWPCAED